MRIKNTLLIYSLLLITSHFVIGMHITKIPLNMKKKFARHNVVKKKIACDVIGQSAELDTMRQKWSSKDSPQDVVNISQGKIIIKEEIPLGKRYGTGYSYAFTKAMGIAGKSSRLLNITGQLDYFAGGLEGREGDFGVNISSCFDLIDGHLAQPGDTVIYISKGKGSEILGSINHTGILVGDDCIESKWGCIPAVFEHPIWYVPARFGNIVLYGRLKISGADLLEVVQKRLEQKSVKEKYKEFAKKDQQELFDLIKYYEHNRSAENVYDIYQHLEWIMNVHVDVPDEHGLTPMMHAEKMGCSRLKGLFTAYEAHRE